mmetsp:Transcript_14069/g.52790  ORF Transcript_14069/g.52790 Transcript_14069/m.52790 type:complete len:364 (+) Transcript_14069:573-1664(+)
MEAAARGCVQGTAALDALLGSLRHGLAACRAGVRRHPLRRPGSISRGSVRGARRGDAVRAQHLLAHQRGGRLRERELLPAVLQHAAAGDARLQVAADDALHHPALPRRHRGRRLVPQHHRDVLQYEQRAELHGGRQPLPHLDLYQLPPGGDRYALREALGRQEHVSLPREHVPAGSARGDAVVCKVVLRHPGHGVAALRIDLHRDVLHLHFLLELQQVLLRLRLHAPGLPDSHGRDHLHDRGGGVLRAERREPQVAVAQLQRGRVNSGLRLRLRRVLLLLQNQHERVPAGCLLLRVHVGLLHRAVHPLRNSWRRRVNGLRAHHIHEHQGGLAHVSRAARTGAGRIDESGCATLYSCGVDSRRH